jgi:3-hydroxybutyrate dehydrogenase
MSRALGEHVLVTGSSGAIGGALARQLRRHSTTLRLTLVDRDAVRGQALASELGQAESLPAELSNVEDLPEIFARAEQKNGPVDGLINCAGFMDIGPVEGMSWETISKLIAVDLVAPLRLMQLVLGPMRQRGSGFVVNVSSMAGRVPLKGCAFYGAAKAGLAMASEIAHVELKESGVRVVTVYPGPVASELERKARAQYEPTFLQRNIPTGEPTELAKRVLEAIFRGKSRVIYPSLYTIGWHGGSALAKFALSVGPDPTQRT